MKPYHRNSPINRPVLHRWPWWQTDIQALPPYSWCARCGGEVYSPTAVCCLRCKPEPDRYIHQKGDALWQNAECFMPPS